MARHGQRQPQAGVTILETLVVLVVIAVMAGALVQSASTVSARRDAEAMTALAARLTLLGDIALASGSSFALRVGTTPWTVSDDFPDKDRQEAIPLDWLDDMTAELFTVVDQEGRAVDTITFHVPPQPQIVIFSGADGEQSITVVFDGLTASVVAGGRDG